MRRASLALLLVLAGCAAASAPPASISAPTVLTPPAGINQVIEGPIAAAPGHSLVLGDLNLAPGAAIPRHRHRGEEFVYVLGGSSVLSRAGERDVTLVAGQSLRIAPDTIHWGRAGPDGMRAISAWVKVDGQPLREAVPE